MDRSDVYLQLIAEQPILLAPFLLFIIIYAAIPADRKLFLTLVLLVPWLTVARSEGLGPIQAAAKLSSGATYLLIAMSAVIHPGPKRQLPQVVWIFVIVAIASIFYVLTTEERARAVVMRVQWVCVTLAGVYTARTIVSYSDLRRVIDGLTWGCIFAIALPFSGFLIDPLGSFLKGQGRFEPWGANSNQIGMLFALTTPLLAYAIMSLKKPSLKPFLLSCLVVTLGMALMTASRQTLLAIILVMIPVFFVLVKRPIFMILAIGMGVIGLSFMLSIGENAEFDRLGNLESGRLDIWYTYWTQVFPSRPLFGLLGTAGQSFEKSLIEVGQHPHNAWFYLMYLGGATLALPMFYLTVYSSYCGVKLWKFRNYLPGNPLLYSILVMLLLAMYIQGLFNQVVYWPTYTWSFLHVVLACLFIAVWQDIRDGKLRESLYNDSDDEEEEDEEYSEDFEDFVNEDPQALE